MNIHELECFDMLRWFSSRDRGYVNRKGSKQCVLETYAHANGLLCQKYIPVLDNPQNTDNQTESMPRMIVTALHAILFLVEEFLVFRCNIHFIAAHTHKWKRRLIKTSVLYFEIAGHYKIVKFWQQIVYMGVFC